jgi:hypothetical protein
MGLNNSNSNNTKDDCGPTPWESVFRIFPRPIGFIGEPGWTPWFSYVWMRRHWCWDMGGGSSRCEYRIDRPAE